MSTDAYLDATFAALADPTRRAILARLTAGERTVGELARPFAMSLPAVSRHLRVLERASLLVKTRAGQTIVCRLNPAMLGEAAEWLAFYRQFWGESLDRLAKHLRNARTPKEAAHGTSRRAGRRKK